MGTQLARLLLVEEEEDTARMIAKGLRHLLFHNL
jgi:hypothetical protein